MRIDRNDASSPTGFTDPISAERARDLLGPISDHTLEAVLALSPGETDVSLAASFLDSGADAPDRGVSALKGLPAEIHRLVAEDPAVAAALSEPER